jgi:hypothetical protein
MAVAGGRGGEGMTGWPLTPAGVTGRRHRERRSRWEPGSQKPPIRGRRDGGGRARRVRDARPQTHGLRGCAGGAKEWGGAGAYHGRQRGAPVDSAADPAARHRRRCRDALLVPPGSALAPAHCLTAPILATANCTSCALLKAAPSSYPMGHEKEALPGSRSSGCASLQCKWRPHHGASPRSCGGQLIARADSVCVQRHAPHKRGAARRPRGAGAAPARNAAMHGAFVSRGRRPCCANAERGFEGCGGVQSLCGAIWRGLCAGRAGQRALGCCPGTVGRSGLAGRGGFAGTWRCGRVWGKRGASGPGSASGARADAATVLLDNAKWQVSMGGWRGARARLRRRVRAQCAPPGRAGARRGRAAGNRVLAPGRDSGAWGLRPANNPAKVLGGKAR